MTDVEAIDHFIENGEHFSMALKHVHEPQEVYYIRKLQTPTKSTIELLEKAFAYSTKKLIVCGVEDISAWTPYFNRFDCVWFDADDNTIVFDKTL